MDQKGALQFLGAHQPMPADELLTQELVETYDEVPRFFLDNPAEESIPLFLNSFGEGNGMGVYQLVEDVAGKHPVETVLPYLKSALESDEASVRYWCAQIAANYGGPDLLEPLGRLLDDASLDIREAAVIALEQVDDVRAAELLRKRLPIETDEGLKNLIHEVLSS